MSDKTTNVNTVSDCISPGYKIIGFGSEVADTRVAQNYRRLQRYRASMTRRRPDVISKADFGAIPCGLTLLSEVESGGNSGFAGAPVCGPGHGGCKIRIVD